MESKIIILLIPILIIIMILYLNRVSLLDLWIGMDEDDTETEWKGIELKMKEQYDKNSYKKLLEEIEKQREEKRNEILKHEENERKERATKEQLKAEEDIKKARDKFEEDRKNELREQTNEQNDNSREFNHAAFAGNTIIDDALWMSATVFTEIKNSIVYANNTIKANKELLANEKEAMKKLETEKLKMETAMKDTVTLKQEFLQAQKDIITLSKVNPNFGLFQKKDKAEHEAKLESAKERLDLIVAEMNKREIVNINEIDNRMNETEQLLNDVMLKIKDCKESMSKGMENSNEAELRLGHYIGEYHHYLEQSREYINDWKVKCESLEDKVKSYESLEKDVTRLKEELENPKLSFLEKSEIERAIELAEVKLQYLKEDIERISGMERGQQSNEEYLNSVKEKYTDLKTYESYIAAEHSIERMNEEFSQFMEKHIENMTPEKQNQLEQQYYERHESSQSFENQIERYDKQIKELESIQDTRLNTIEKMMNEATNELKNLQNEEANKKGLEMLQNRINDLRVLQSTITGKVVEGAQYNNKEATIANSVNAEKSQVEKKKEDSEDRYHKLKEREEKNQEEREKKEREGGR